MQYHLHFTIIMQISLPRQFSSTIVNVISGNNEISITILILEPMVIP